MADQKVSDLPSLNGADVDAADLLYIVDSSAGSAGSKKITVGQYQLAPVSGGTANGVVYLNGSKVVTTGSGLVFDGTNLGIGTSSPVAKLTVNGNQSFSNTTYQIGYALNTETGTVAGANSPFYGLNMATFTGFSGNGIGLHGYYGLLFSTAGIERMRLDSSGNLGLGVTPSAWSGVVAMQLPTGAALTGFSNTTNLVQNAYYNGSWRYISTAAAALAQVTQGAHQWFTAPSGTAGNAISFTQAMTLTSGGDLLVGLSSPAFVSTRLEVEAATNNNALGAKTTQNNYAPLMAWNSATTGDNLFQYFYTEGTLTLRGSITYNRAGGLVAYNTTSDYRAKDIIGPVQNPGATIDALKVYEGVMKGATQSRPMLVAHEAQAVAPYCVTGEKDEVNEDGTPKFQQMDVSSLVPLLLAEIQTLRARVAALESA